MSAPLPEGEALAAAAKAIPDDAMAGARQTALDRFLESGFPTVREEDWKYTDLSGVAEISRRWLEGGAARPGVDAQLVEDITQSIDAVWLVIGNGEFIEEASTVLGEKDVKLSRASSSSSDVKPAPFPLADLNLALAPDILELEVNADRYDDRPIGVLLVDTAPENAVSAQVRLDIRIADDCGARILEWHASTGDGDHYSNSVISLAIGGAARCDYFRYQDRARSHSHTGRLDARLGKDAVFRHFAADIGGKLTRSDLHVDLSATGADARFDGVYIARDGQHIDNHTRVDHRVGPAQSRQEYRGILSGKSRAVWNGKVIVHDGADGTDAEQANHNLLLSERAEIDAKPELEIYADEVKCSHGTTVGQLDESAIFYLQSRGLDRELAQRMLTRAFAATVVDSAPVPEVHDIVQARIDQRLENIVEAEQA